MLRPNMAAMKKIMIKIFRNKPEPLITLIEIIGRIKNGIKHNKKVIEINMFNWNI
jgi:hypothetical protein